MRFRPPFDDVQWDEASRTHAQMRRNVRELRRRYPPNSLDEALLVRRYRDAVQEFGGELLKPHGKIRPALLNELNDTVVSAFVAYMAVRSSS